MKALITGASSGIGASFAVYLSQLGYDLILVARDKKRLQEVKEKCHTKVELLTFDLSIPENCFKLYQEVKKETINILINNAGFGSWGNFIQEDIDKQLNMIDLNIKAVHILTKLFLSDFIKRDSGYILNVGSSASFSPGPLMATYYATKNYVLRLTEAIYQELKEQKSNVYIGAFCPGPVKTEFTKKIGVGFSTKALESDDVVRFAIKKMWKRKLIIIPDFMLRLNCTFNKIVPIKILLKANYNVQIKKKPNEYS